MLVSFCTVLSATNIATNVIALLQSESIIVLIYTDFDFRLVYLYGR